MSEKDRLPNFILTFESGGYWVSIDLNIVSPKVVMLITKLRFWAENTRKTHLPPPRLVFPASIMG
jgi:hypothetical protein